MKYSPQLDGLRAVAAAVVLLFHAKVPGINGGFLGVDVFFVLSGYLITRLLVAERERDGSINYSGFFVRRLYRLYPALLVFIATYLAVAPFVFADTGMGKHLQDALVSGFYMADYARTLGGPVLYINHAWTLSIEEKFYLIWPLVIIFLARFSHSTAIKLLGLMFIIATAWRVSEVTSLDNYWHVYDRLDTHCSGLILGSLLGFARIKLPPPFALLGAAGLAATMYFASWKDFSTALVGFTAAEVFAAMLVCSQPKALGKGVLPWLGKMSYGFYLWHYLFIRIGRELDAGFWATLGMATAGGLVCAALSYYTIEAAFRSKRQKSIGDTRSV